MRWQSRPLSVMYAFGVLTMRLSRFVLHASRRVVRNRVSRSAACERRVFAGSPRSLPRPSTFSSEAEVAASAASRRRTLAWS